MVFLLSWVILLYVETVCVCIKHADTCVKAGASSSSDEVEVIKSLSWPSGVFFWIWGCTDLMIRHSFTAEPDTPAKHSGRSPGELKGKEVGFGVVRITHPHSITLWFTTLTGLSDGVGIIHSFWKHCLCWDLILSATRVKHGLYVRDTSS